MDNSEEKRIIDFCTALSVNKPVTVTVIPGHFTEVESRHTSERTFDDIFIVGVKFDQEIFDSLPLEVKRVMPTWCHLDYKQTMQNDVKCRSFIIYQDNEKIYVAYIDGDIKSIMTNYNNTHKYRDFGK